MSRRPPEVFTIPAGVNFVDALARGILAQYGDDPLALSSLRILLPTRRACRGLQEAFLRAGEGRALLLPRLSPLGDVDEEELLLDPTPDLPTPEGRELPPLLSAFRRTLLLARLVQNWSQRRGSMPLEDQAILMAQELGRLIDEVETEGLEFDGIDGVVPEELAEHWGQTLRFLEIVTHHWPEIEVENGGIGPARRRRLLMEAQAAAWRITPPEHPVIAAGSTGTIPSTAELLKVVAGLPHGSIVLPGLDLEADAATWDAVGADPNHPQHALCRLLTRLECERRDVRRWDCAGLPETAPARTALVNRALAPAICTVAWRDYAETAERGGLRAAMARVRRIDCPDAGEEARVIAMLMRGALETPARTAALVTPDRQLARRVAAELARWNLAVDDSAGIPLSETPPGSFLRLTAEALARQLSPVTLLAALKHPLAAGGESPGRFRAQVRRLEVAILRGPRPAPGFAGLLRALDALDTPQPELRAWVQGLADAAQAAEAAIRRRSVDFGAILDAHLAFAEALAASDEEPGPARLWHGEAGEALAEVLRELREGADAAPPVSGERYPYVLDALLAGQAVRPRFGRHPRLFIWGLMEARLQHADLVILGGLNEGSWPAETDPGPWLSRPMRRAFGLPTPEQRIGIAAHDFVQAFSAGEVALTRATRVDGTPTVPSRWLLRLETLLAALGLADLLQPGGGEWLAWGERLDAPEARAPVGRPAPCPPRAARPRSLSVTRIETWMRDPYALYAEKILGLKALEPLDADPGGAEQGMLIHAILEAFVRRYPEAAPEAAEDALLALGEAGFRKLSARPGLQAFWWPRFKRTAAWIAGEEARRRAGVARVLPEKLGRLEIETAGGGFTLTALADRIERLADGSLRIIDYKTGSLPSGKAVKLGFSPQLPLEAAIAAAGGFDDLEPAAVSALEYWRLSGGEPPGEKQVMKGDPIEEAERALAGLKRLVEDFEDPARAYMARPRPAWVPRWSDYGHLARVQEWSSGGEDGE